MTTLEQLLKRSAALEQSDSPRLDTEVLLCHVINQPRSFLYTWPEKQLTPEQLRLFEALFARRLKGEPVAHLTGQREFWSLSLRVTPATLIPRPDTELLVELVLALPAPDRALMLDLGTGTGAIALAVASERPHWQITAVDLESAAVQLAEENRDRLGINNVAVLQSGWYSALGESRFNIIVSNPPYIAADDIHLQQGDVRFEPRSALVATDNGLADISSIVGGAKNSLLPGGWLLIEHGCDQAVAVRELMAAAGFAGVETRVDINGRDRVSLCCRARS